MLNIPMPLMPKVPCRPGVPPPRVPEALQWPMSLLLEKFTKYRAELVKEVADAVGKGQVKSVNGRTGDVTLAAADVGLGNVANTGDSAVPVEGGTAKFTTGGAYAELAKKVSIADLFDNPATAPTVKSSLLPSYVDDVLEYASLAAFPQPGETGKIYVAKDANKTYRWSGTQYTEIANPDLSNYVQNVPGKGLSTNDYDNVEKGKVATALQPADIDSTLSAQNKAADAKATGDALAGKRDKDDLALYKKVGVGDTWTLVATQSGYEGITTTVTGVFSGDEPAHWGFYLDGEGVAGSSEAVDADSCEVQWTGSEDVGLSGIARRPFTYQPVTGDALAKTSQLPTTPEDIGAATAAQGAKADTAVQPDALAGAVRYDFPASVTEITSEDVSTDESVTPNINYAEATLADRTMNWIEISADCDELRLTLPGVNGKVRDFGLRVEVGTGSAALTAPALKIIFSGEGGDTSVENPDGAIPELADGTATAAGVTILYFTETAPDRFLVKGEEVKEVS